MGENKGWDIIIYIIIGLISVIGGIYKNANDKKEEERQRQRRKQANLPAPKDSHQTDISKEMERDPFEDFIRRQLGQIEEKPVQSKPQAAPIIKKTETQPKQILQEGIPVFETTKSSLISNRIVEDSLLQEDHINSIEEYDYNAISKDEISDSFDMELSDFEPKKAVIYSEILNRKEF